MITDYSGAGSRLTPDRGLALSPRTWAFSPKLDGAYCQARTDSAGHIAGLYYRSGSPVPAGDSDGLVGLAIGLPDAVLHGELEAQTEAGRRARETRGSAALHLFDVSAWSGRRVATQPYSERYGLLHRWQSNVQCYTGEQETLEPCGRWRDGQTGRYTRTELGNLARLPIVPLHRGPSAGEQLWRSYVEVGGGEGIVAVRLDAPLGARGAKRKVKATDTLDCVVLAVDSSAAVLSWRGHRFTVSARSKRWTLTPGAVAEVICDGWYEAGVVPRFARVVRVRADLSI